MTQRLLLAAVAALYLPTAAIAAELNEGPAPSPVPAATAENVDRSIENIETGNHGKRRFVEEIVITSDRSDRAEPEALSAELEEVVNAAAKAGGR